MPDDDHGAVVMTMIVRVRHPAMDNDDRSGLGWRCKGNKKSQGAQGGKREDEPSHS
jgi:hypothetical protein